MSMLAAITPADCTSAPHRQVRFASWPERIGSVVRRLHNPDGGIIFTLVWIQMETQSGRLRSTQRHDILLAIMCFRGQFGGRRAQAPSKVFWRKWRNLLLQFDHKQSSRCAPGAAFTTAEPGSAVSMRSSNFSAGDKNDRSSVSRSRCLGPSRHQSAARHDVHFYLPRSRHKRPGVLPGGLAPSVGVWTARRNGGAFPRPGASLSGAGKSNEPPHPSPRPPCR